MRFKVLAASALLMLMVTGCSEQQKTAPAAAPAPEVGIQVIKLKSLTISERYAGKTKALSKVSVVPQVSGVITKVHVIEGQEIKRGTVMFEIDPQPFEAEVLRQQSNFKQAEAGLALAEVKYEMSKGLAGSDAMSKLDAEQIKVNRDVAEAALAAANASLVQAQLSLKKSKVPAPITGVVGITNFDVGDLVGTAQGAIVDIVANGQIEVYTQIGEKAHFASVARKLKNQEIIADTLELELADGSMYNQLGKINFIGSEVSAGTVTYRVIFANPDGLLLGGQNVTILATAGKATSFHYIPQMAVMEDQQGRFIYVVGKDNIVEKRVVKLGKRYGVNWIVEDGVQDGEKVIVSGILKAKVGQAVSPVEE